jgi:hypothetical protein
VARKDRAVISRPPMTLSEILEHISICPDGCGVCKAMACDAIEAETALRTRIAELEQENERLKAERAGDQQRLFHYESCTAELEKALSFYRENGTMGIADLQARVAELEAYVEIQRAAQISAVNQMVAAEKREATAIERCAQVAESTITENNSYKDDRSREIAAAIRAQKDKPVEPATTREEYDEWDRPV